MEDKEVPPLIAHVERFLGSMESGWKGDNGEDPHIWICAYKNQPCEGYTSYVSLGLSSHTLKGCCNEYRQELIFATQNSVSHSEALYLMMSHAQYMVSRHEAVLRGEVIGPYTKLPLSDTKMTALYASHPVIFDDELSIFEGSNPPTVFVWLFPIHTEEAEFIHKHGWSKFEDILVEKDPDLLDFQRESVV